MYLLNEGRVDPQEIEIFWEDIEKNGLARGYIPVNGYERNAMKKVYLESVKSVKQIVMLGMVLIFVNRNSQLVMDILLAVPESDRMWVVIGILAVFSCPSWSEAVMTIGVATVKRIKTWIEKISQKKS